MILLERILHVPGSDYSLLKMSLRSVNYETTSENAFATQETNTIELYRT